MWPSWHDGLQGMGFSTATRPDGTMDITLSLDDALLPQHGPGMQESDDTATDTQPQQPARKSQALIVDTSADTAAYRASVTPAAVPAYLGGTVGNGNMGGHEEGGAVVHDGHSSSHKGGAGPGLKHSAGGYDDGKTQAEAGSDAHQHAPLEGKEQYVGDIPKGPSHNKTDNSSLSLTLTLQPSLILSLNPTLQPSLNPTKAPILQLTEQPTLAGILQLTDQPTLASILQVWLERRRSGAGCGTIATMPDSAVENMAYGQGQVPAP